MLQRRTLTNVAYRKHRAMSTSRFQKEGSLFLPRSKGNSHSRVLTFFPDNAAKLVQLRKENYLDANFAIRCVRLHSRGTGARFEDNEPAWLVRREKLHCPSSGCSSLSSDARFSFFGPLRHRPVRILLVDQVSLPSAEENNDVVVALGLLTAGVYLVVGRGEYREESDPQTCNEHCIIIRRIDEGNEFPSLNTAWLSW